MRHMSFMHTTPQMHDRSKTVTRRKGWENLKPGDRLLAVEKGQGLKKGEKVKPICVIEVVNNWREYLQTITSSDVKKEGYPLMSKREFILMFCEHMRVLPITKISRIEFRYV